jgi:hypothetical protein
MANSMAVKENNTFFIMMLLNGLLFKGFSASPEYGFYTNLQYTIEIIAVSPVFTQVIPGLPACCLKFSLPEVRKQPNPGACFRVKNHLQ